MSAFKGLMITVMLSWGQHLPTRDIKAVPPVRAELPAGVRVTGPVMLE